MITVIENLPSNMVGFKASGEINQDDFTNTVMPRVKESIERNGTLNYMLVLNTDLKNFSAGAWLKDALMGIRHLFKWNRAAIVTDTGSVINFTKVFSAFMPGEFRGFRHNDLQKAISWASTGRD